MPVKMDYFEHQMRKALDEGIIHGAVVLAKDKSGKLDYAQTFGHRTLSPSPEPMTKDTIFMFASMTKLLTTIACLQLVERDLITLDSDVASFLPSLAKQDILTGFSPQDSKPILKKRGKTITLRHLLTHSYGGTYDFMSPDLIGRWKKENGLPAQGRSVEEIFGTPLLFEPGEGWIYSGGLDWAGLIVEQLSGTGLESYMKAHIWGPLGLEDITFWPDSRPDIADRRAQMNIRDFDTGKAVPSRKPINISEGATEALGGQGAFGSMSDYIQVLESLLQDDERLLKKETTKLMFEPQLTRESKEALLESFRHPDWAVGSFPDTAEYDWGLGGVLIDGERHEVRRKGTMMWSGNANLFWFLDRTSGVCGVFGCQLLPPADAQIEVLIKTFEEEVYKQAGTRANL